MKIYVKILNEKKLEIEVDENDKVEHIRKQVPERAGISRRDMKLEFNGCELEDGWHIKDYYITDESIIKIGSLPQRIQIVEDKVTLDKQKVGVQVGMEVSRNKKVEKFVPETPSEAVDGDIRTANRKGICLVISNSSFDGDIKKELYRAGTGKDEESIAKTFTSQGFDVQVSHLFAYIMQFTHQLDQDMTKTWNY